METVAGCEKRPNTSTENGFTLLELLVVLVILGLLAAFAMPRLRLGDGQRMRAVGKALGADLRLLRVDAMRYGGVTSIVPTIDGYMLEPSALHRGLPAGFSITTKSAGTALVPEPRDQIAFFPDGSSTGGTVRVNSSGLSATVNVRALDGRVKLDER